MKKWIADFADVFHRNALAGWVIAFFIRKGVLWDSAENTLRFLGAYVVGMLIAEFGQIVGAAMGKSRDGGTKSKLISFAIQTVFLCFATAYLF